MTAVHIDHGLMRKDESAAVIESLEAVGLQVKLVPASLEFQSGHTVIPDTGAQEGGGAEKKTGLLCQVTDPEVKRKIIGDRVSKVADRVIKDLNLDLEKVGDSVSDGHKTSGLPVGGAGSGNSAPRSHNECQQPGNQRLCLLHQDPP